MQVTYDKKAGTVTITLPVAKDPRPSSTGKSLLLASESVPNAVTIEGKQAKVAVNVYAKV